MKNTIKHHLENHHNIGRLYNSYLISTDNLELSLNEVIQFIKERVLIEGNLDSHPDYFYIAKTDSTTKNITIDQIRALQDFLYKTSILSGKKIAIIYEADQMNLNSANACLKILEDTPSNTHLFLITENASSILPTMRSRCAKINSHYDPHGKRDIDERFTKILLKSGDLSDRLTFIKEFASKDRSLWLRFASLAQELIAKFCKHIVGSEATISSLEKQVLAQFQSNSPIYLQNKYEKIKELIDNTNNFDLDLRASCVLLIEEFRK